ncbi:hypothetical protein HYFRA_00000784 [Hymenoscyphus fraxineus]|uniref:Protein kinase domain-containing protein n=1 Tax=Hymenoscyphus fraxineus TaxID=746836 RepID=A0A9N9KSU1_9HELO|nr:hypothetical protein HYFRA_00000784 [Hymenoscyphus fraxineus]
MSSADEIRETSLQGNASKKAEEAGITVLPSSDGASVGLTQSPVTSESGRPPIFQHLSAPTYHSPIRHHKRQASQHRGVKETLNAKSEYRNNDEDGHGEHRINQYTIKDEIGRGSFGAVHLAVDQYGKEYAVKEFSKSRLRKRAQSNILRRPHQPRRPGHLAAGLGFNAPLHRHSASDVHIAEENGNPLYLIKEEIAIMKKLDHPNLVSLIEVLDDPEEDSLYMVLEMCKKGVVMKVGLGQQSDPYDLESCRCWFRDLILGIEYLHAQGIIHRDIKPDNLLLTEDDVLKIVDFGVSEMFEKESEMRTAKSAGSPAFLPPELCVTKHGDVSGKAADIWSMGVSLYCLRFGKIPFERTGVLELYEAIKTDEVVVEPEDNPDFCDLLKRLLEKDPRKRITMSGIREHPWVTKSGADPLLSAAENTADLIEPPSEIEVNHAITYKMRNLLTMMKAVKKFKSLVDKHTKGPNVLSNVLDKGLRSIEAATSGPTGLAQKTDLVLQRSKSVDHDDRDAIESALASEGVHRDIKQTGPFKTGGSIEPVVDSDLDLASKRPVSRFDGASSDEISGEPITEISRGESPGEKGHAHDPLDGEPLFFGIGAGEDVALDASSENIIAESPTAADFPIYVTAYQEEVQRIREAQGQTATIYSTRRVDDKKKLGTSEEVAKVPQLAMGLGLPSGALKTILAQSKEDGDEKGNNNQSFSDLASRIVENGREKGKDLLQKAGDKKDEILEKRAETKYK